MQTNMHANPFVAAGRITHYLTIVGAHDYATIVATYHREPQRYIVARLFDSFREDFVRAAEFIGPKEWVHLAWQRPCRLHCLTDPSFDPRVALAQRAGTPSDIVPDRLSIEEVEYFARTTPNALRAANPDVAKAAWCMISVVRQLCRTNDSIEDEPWWEPRWFLEKLPQIPRWKTRPFEEVVGSLMSGANSDDPI
jgi:hypothetical protein